MTIGLGDMAGQASDTFNFPAWIQIAVAILGVIGFIVTVVSLFLAVQWSPRRTNEDPRIGRPLKIIRFWRPTQYSLALGYLAEYCQSLINRKYHVSDERGYVTESDLIRWAFQIALTCAACMVPHSLGKANLFRVSRIITDGDNRRIELHVYSSEFVGVFSPRQLVDPLDNTRLRNLELAPSRQSSDRYPAALQCVGEGIPIIQSLKNRRATFDEPEKALGATHIVAIPLVRDISTLTTSDQPTSITIDLHFGRITGWMLDHRDFQRTTIYRRAERLSKILMSVQQLSAPMMLVPTESKRPKQIGQGTGSGEPGPSSTNEG